MSMKLFKNKYDILYIVEEVFTRLFNGNIFEKNQLSHFFKLLVNHPFTNRKTKRTIFIVTMSFHIFWILRTGFEKLSMTYWYSKF